MDERIHHHATRGTEAAVALLTLLTLCAPVATQKRGTAQKKQDKQPAPTWPALSKADTAKGVKWLKLIASKKEKTRAKAATILVELGPGMGDRLFKRFNDRAKDNRNEYLTAVLEQILKPEHAPLIALHAKNKSLDARRYVFKKLAKIGDANIAPTLAKARDDDDIEVSYYARLGLVRTTRDTKALDGILKRCNTDWAELEHEVFRYLSPARDAAFLPWCRKNLAKDDVETQKTTLRLMRALAPKEAKNLVGQFLDSRDAILKKESINTLRVIVDGDKPLPLKQITSFLVIKMAKQWKARL